MRDRWGISIPGEIGQALPSRCAASEIIQVSSVDLRTLYKTFLYSQEVYMLLDLKKRYPESFLEVAKDIFGVNASCFP